MGSKNNLTNDYFHGYTENSITKGETAGLVFGILFFLLLFGIIIGVVILCFHRKKQSKVYGFNFLKLYCCCDFRNVPIVPRVTTTDQINRVSNVNNYSGNNRNLEIISEPVSKSRNFGVRSPKDFPKPVICHGNRLTLEPQKIEKKNSPPKVPDKPKVTIEKARAENKQEYNQQYDRNNNTNRKENRMKNLATLFCDFKERFDLLACYYLNNPSSDKIETSGDLGLDETEIQSLENLMDTVEKNVFIKMMKTFFIKKPVSLLLGGQVFLFTKNGNTLNGVGLIEKKDEDYQQETKIVARKKDVWLFIATYKASLDISKEEINSIFDKAYSTLK